jgi:hypothetical protein
MKRVVKSVYGKYLSDKFLTQYGLKGDCSIVTAFNFTLEYAMSK